MLSLVSQPTVRIELPKPTLERAAELFPYPDGMAPHEPPYKDCEHCRINRLRENWLRARGYVDQRGITPAPMGTLHGIAYK